MCIHLSVCIYVSTQSIDCNNSNRLDKNLKLTSETRESLFVVVVCVNVAYTTRLTYKHTSAAAMHFAAKNF